MTEPHDLARRLVVTSLAGVTSTLFLFSLRVGPAAADVVAPPGNCVGTGKFETGVRNGDGARVPFSVDSRTLPAGATVEIPLKDAVDWGGWLPRLAGVDPTASSPPPSARIAGRGIRGYFQVQLPPPIGWRTVDDWGVKVAQTNTSRPSDRVASKGQHRYDLPSVLAGLQVKVRGYHYENVTDASSGSLYCSGTAIVRLEGSITDNPAAEAAAVALVLSGALVVYASRATTATVQHVWDSTSTGGPPDG